MDHHRLPMSRHRGPDRRHLILIMPRLLNFIVAIYLISSD